MDNNEMGYTNEADVALSEADMAAFDEGWGDDPETVDEDDLEDLGDIDTAEDGETETSEADDTGEAGESDVTDEAEEDGQNEENAEPEDSKAEEGHQLYTLKGINGEAQYSLDDVLKLANKGLDYDGIRQDRDRLREYEAFLKTIASQSNMSVDELIDSTRARVYKEKKASEGEEVSDIEALLAVQRERSEKKTTASEAETKKANTDRMIQKFISEFRDVEAKDIPESVWKEAHETGDLAGAYRKYANSQKDAEIKRLEAENKALKQNKKNKERSIGSLKTAGAAKNKDPFDEGWDSI